MPSDPASVTAAAGSADASAIHLRWTHAGASDDNLAADVVFDVERRVDAGSWSTVATGLALKYFVDSGLAAGAYDYRVTARNAYHARTSSAVQSSAAVTVPVSAGGGGKPPLERGMAA